MDVTTIRASKLLNLSFENQSNPNPVILMTTSNEKMTVNTRLTY
jgi:hypothetical protein